MPSSMRFNCSPFQRPLGPVDIDRFQLAQDGNHLLNIRIARLALFRLVQRVQVQRGQL